MTSIYNLSDKIKIDCSEYDQRVLLLEKLDTSEDVMLSALMIELDYDEEEKLIDLFLGVCFDTPIKNPSFLINSKSDVLRFIIQTFFEKHKWDSKISGESKLELRNKAQDFFSVDHEHACHSVKIKEQVTRKIGRDESGRMTYETASGF